MKFLVILSLLFISLSSGQDVYLHWGEYDPDNGTLEIRIEPDVPVLGLQMRITGIQITQVELGPLLSEFVLSFNSEGELFLFSFGSILPEYNHLFCTLSFDEILEPFSCFEDVIIVGEGGDYLSFESDDFLDTGLCFPAGDMNQDTILDVGDIILIVGCILLYDDCPCADINGDNFVDILDIIIIVGWILGE